MNSTSGRFPPLFRKLLCKYHYIRMCHVYLQYLLHIVRTGHIITQGHLSRFNLADSSLFSLWQRD